MLEEIVITIIRVRVAPEEHFLCAGSTFYAPGVQVSVLIPSCNLWSSPRRLVLQLGN